METAAEGPVERGLDHKISSSHPTQAVERDSNRTAERHGAARHDSLSDTGKLSDTKSDKLSNDSLAVQWCTACLAVLDGG